MVLSAEYTVRSEPSILCDRIAPAVRHNLRSGSCDTTSHSTESVDRRMLLRCQRTIGLGRSGREAFGDWSQSGVEPPHSKVAADWHSIVKEQFRCANNVLWQSPKVLATLAMQRADRQSDL